MIATETLLAFVFASVLIEVTPGPNMGYLALIAATEGRRKGFYLVAGVALGLATIGLLAALGLAAVISNSPTAFAVLRWAGIAYLIWLAWDAWTGEGEEDGGPLEGRGWRYFRRGLVTNLLNPKAGVFYVSMLPGFVNPALPTLPQTLTLSLVFVAVATGIHAGIVGLAGFAQDFLNDPARRRPVRRVMAVILLGIAIWFAWETR